eukprot:jgi/Chlat1/7835/Chrsp66S07283
MGTVAFPELGKHCSYEGCQLVDFLPFDCDACKRIYCLDHRTYREHECSVAGDRDTSVLVCPLCLKGVRLIPGENPNLTWERHASSSGACDPANYARVKKRRRCPVPGCKEALTFSNKFACRDCHTDICLRHRFAKDHACAERRNAAQAAAAAAIKQRSLLQRAKDTLNAAVASSSVTSTAKARQKTAVSANAPDPSNTLRGSAQRRIMQAGSVLNSNTSGPEVCPQCGDRFADVGALVCHVEAAHQSSEAQQKDNRCLVC